jgi:hypothetical protein
MFMINRTPVGACASDFRMPQSTKSSTAVRASSLKVMAFSSKTCTCTPRRPE